MRLLFLVFAISTIAQQPQERQKLLAQLESKDWILQVEAIRVLSQWGVTEAVAGMTHILRTSQSPWLRGEALIGLARLEGATWQQDARTLAENEAPELRRAAVRALGLMPGDDVAALRARLDDADSATRYAALAEFAKRQPAWDLVDEPTREPPVEVLRLAAEALAHVASPEALARLQQLYVAAPASKKSEVIKGIDAVRDTRLLPVLLDILTRYESRRVRMHTQPGDATVNLWMREDSVGIDKIVMTRDAHFVPVGKGPDATVLTEGLYVEAEGMIVFEAEGFTGQAAGQNECAGHDWVLSKERGDFSGEGALIGLPEGQINTMDKAIGPRRDYRLRFGEGEICYVWARIWGPGEGNDSVHMGLNGHPVTLGGYGLSNSSDSWRWVRRVQGLTGANLCIQAINAYPAAEIANQVRVAFAQGESPIFAAAARTAARVCADKKMGEALAAALEGELSAENVVAGLEALATPALEPQHHQELFARFLKAPEPFVRMQAIRCLALCPEARLFELLRSVVHDAHDRVSSEALTVLARVRQYAPPTEGIRAYLGPLLRRQESTLQALVLQVVGLYGRTDEADALLSDLRPILTGKSENRSAAAQALARFSPAESAREVAAVQGFVTDWMVIGTFLNDGENSGFETAYPPEKEIDYGKGYEAAYRWTLDNEGRRKDKDAKLLREVSWHAAWTGADGRLRMSHMMPPPAEFAVGYAVADFVAEAPIAVSATIEADDGIRLWMNEIELLNATTEESNSRDYAPLRRELQLEFPAGRSRLLIKSTNLEGPWGFSLRLASSELRMIRVSTAALGQE